MRHKFQRKIVKDRKEKEQYSTNLPRELVKILELKDSWVELEIIGKSIVCKKIDNSTQTTQNIQTEKEKPYDFGDETY